VTTRSAWYIDGFNLYHSINDLNEPHLKWLDLSRLARLVMPRESEMLAKIVFCTAFYPRDANKRWRHEEYLAALRVSGVVPVMGHYVDEKADCRKCYASWIKPVEKETDINIAITLLNDAWLDVYDKAYLLTADSDQAATARLFRTQFPSKDLITVSPPGRNFSSHILASAHGKLALNKEHLERCLFPPIVFREGQRAGRRPKEYDPPPGWIIPPQ
jgi:hypothetical protein